MAFKITIQNYEDPPVQATHVFPADEVLFVELGSCGRNTWKQSTLSAIAPGDHIRLRSTLSKLCVEVVTVEEV